MNSVAKFRGCIYEFSFDHFIFPTILRILYGLSWIGAVFLALYAVVLGFQASVVYGIVWLILAPVLFLVTTIFARLMLELYMALFRIAEDTHAVRTGGHEGKTDVKESRLAA